MQTYSAPVLSAHGGARAQHRHDRRVLQSLGLDPADCTAVSSRCPSARLGAVRGRAARVSLRLFDLGSHQMGAPRAPLGVLVN